MAKITHVSKVQTLNSKDRVTYKAKYFVKVATKRPGDYSGGASHASFFKRKADAHKFRIRALKAKKRGALNFA